MAYLLGAALIMPACSDNSGGGVDAGGVDGGGGALAGVELTNACIRASACGFQAYPILANCIDAYYDTYLKQGMAPIYDKIYRCVNSAGGDCSGVKTCYDQRGTCDGTYRATCDGKVAVTCDLLDQRIYAYNCGNAKMECRISASSAALASCTPGDCISGFGKNCRGAWLLTCNQNVVEVRDCAAEGMTCDTAKEGCVGETSQMCHPQSFKASCKGDVAISSCEGGYEHHVDCSKQTLQGTRCSQAVCVVAGSECDHAINRCSGSQLEACIDGRWVKHDCAALGLGPCKTAGTRGANCSNKN